MISAALFYISIRGFSASIFTVEKQSDDHFWFIIFLYRSYISGSGPLYAFGIIWWSVAGDRVSGCRQNRENFNMVQYQQHCGDMKLVENGQTIVTISQCFFKEMLSYLTTAVNRNKQKSAVNSLGTTFSRGLIHIWLVCAEVLTLYKSEYFLPLGNRKM